MTFKRLARNINRLKLELLESVEEVQGRGYALGLKGGDVEVLTGKNKGSVSDGKLPAQRLAHIRLGTMYSTDYQQQLEVHPELIRNGSVQLVRIHEPQEINELELFVTPRRDIDLAELEYLVRIYLSE